MQMRRHLGLKTGGRMKKGLLWGLLITGILSVIAGIYTICRPMVSLISLSFFFAAVLFINGVYEIMRYFYDKENRSGFMLFDGIVTVVISLILLSGPLITMASLIPYLFVFWVLFSAASRIFIGFGIRKLDRREGNYLLLIGVIGILCGIVMALHPLFTGLIIAYMIGFAFLYQGVINIVSFSRLRKSIK